jgi:hypothetical protein
MTWLRGIVLVGVLAAAAGCSNGNNGGGGTPAAVDGSSAGPDQSPYQGVLDSGGQSDITMFHDQSVAWPDSQGPAVKKACFPYCSSMADCPQGAVACKNKVCMMCTSDSHCQQMGGAKKCDVATGSCIMCTQDSHCSYYGQPMWSGKCDTQLKLCVKCNTDSDCNWKNSTTKLCVASRCVQCKSDADCASSHAKGCDQFGFCSKCKSDVECCPPGQTCGLKCDVGLGACLCQTDKNCSDVFTQGKWECRAPTP